MITDRKTNKLYLADTLAKQYPDFYARFVEVLNACGIDHATIPGTKDIWAVDYMPIQVTAGEFVQFSYRPDYLRVKKWAHTISDVDAICLQMRLKPIKSNIVIDGGNVVRSAGKVIMCDKVFKENPSYTNPVLIAKLERLFESEIFFVPRQPGDYTGHADGMLRFIDNDTLLINNYENEPAHFKRAFYTALKNTRLNWIELPYNPHRNPVQANGCYINYLQMANTIIMPIYGLKEDNAALKQLENLFKGCQIIPVEANEIANNGGVLNCISWNIFLSSEFCIFDNINTKGNVQNSLISRQREPQHRNAGGVLG